VVVLINGLFGSVAFAEIVYTSTYDGKGYTSVMLKKRQEGKLTGLLMQFKWIPLLKRSSTPVSYI